MIDAAVGGVLTGLSAAVFAASAALLVLQTATVTGARGASVAGAGVATADALWAAVVTVIGATPAAAALREQWAGLWKWVAVGALVAVGVSLIRNLLSGNLTPLYRAVCPTESGPALYRSFLGHTVVDPVTVVFFVSLMAGPARGRPPAAAAVFVAGVFLGSLCWQSGLVLWGARRGAPFSPVAGRRLGWLDAGLLVVFTAYVALGT